MTIHDYISAHPDDPLRIILYEPAPDVLDEHGDLVCGGEGKSAVVFDSTVSGDMSFDLPRREITAINTGDDGVTELEFIPDDCYFPF